MKTLTTIGSLILLAGCSTTLVQTDLPCPLRPIPLLISTETQLGVAADIKAIKEDFDLPELHHRLDILHEREEFLQEALITLSAKNQLRFKQHIRDLEILSGCQ